MRFDNAYLTCKWKLGVQFCIGRDAFHRPILLTVYEDNKGNKHCSEEATEEQKAVAFRKYDNLKKQYMPAKAV